LEKSSLIIGIDGGGSYTTGCLFDVNGNTIKKNITKGTNLSIYRELAVSRLSNLLEQLTKNNGLNLEDISAIGFGLSGVSDLNQRELLLKELDKLQISHKSLILSDAEIAFNLLCPVGVGFLVCIGTGVICLARDENGKTYRIAGKGHKKDIGSGYWIGKQAVDRILINSGLISIDSDLNEIYNIILSKNNISDLNDLSEILLDEKQSVCKIASLSMDIIDLAEKGNDVALSIIQEGTRNIGDYIINLLDKLKYRNKSIIISGHGSVLKNTFYRKLLNQSLEFEINNLQWLLSNISPAYTAGIMAAAARNINVSIEDVVKNIKN